MQQSGPGRRRARGAVAITFVVMLLTLLGFIGMALDLSQVYNRKAELQSLADAAALAASRELAGTAAGVTAAASRAAAVATQFRYHFDTTAVAWSDEALRFSADATAPDAAWLGVAAAQAAPDGLLFAKVDTAALAAAHGSVSTVIMGLLASELATTSTAARAVAGRAAINALPLAICAMSNDAAAPRATTVPSNPELSEYGFRRGVDYDLMQLNPGGTLPEHFLIDPLAPPGTPGAAGNVANAVAGPMVCAGRMLMPRLRGGPIRVQRGFPIGALFEHLNSRFDSYPAGACSVNGAPPDANVKQYTPGALPWMATVPLVQSARPSTAGGKLWTVADQAGGAAATAYGPLWTFARAVPFSAYSAGAPEPGAGYTGYLPANWSILYAPTAPAAYTIAYPSTSPYFATGGANFQAPGSANGPGLRLRRVLNVPLLACPVAAGATAAANVLAVARFFMTVPATKDNLYAEFAGIVPEQSLGAPPELMP